MKPYPATFDETTFSELIAHRRQSAEPRDWRVSRAEQEDEGMVLGAARWLAVCLIFVALAAVSVVFA